MDYEFERMKKEFAEDIEKLLGKEKSGEYLSNVDIGVAALQKKFSRRLISQEQGRLVINTGREMLKEQYVFEPILDGGNLAGYAIKDKQNNTMAEKTFDYFKKQ